MQKIQFIVGQTLSFFFISLLPGNLIAQTDKTTVSMGIRPVDNQLVLPAFVKTQENKPTDIQQQISSDKSEKLNLSKAIGAKFILKGVRFEGNQIFTSSELEEVCLPFINQQVDLGDLEEIRFRLTKYYTQLGFENSGVLIPKQHIVAGIVYFNVIEGKLTAINITGNERLKKHYISDRLSFDQDQAFNSQNLHNSFIELLQDPLIDRLNGKISPTNKIGEAILDLDVKRARAYDISLTTDNHHSPSSGEYQAYLTATLWNLSGYGDRLDLRLNTTEGNNDYYSKFSLPILPNNTQLFFSYTNGQSSVIEASLRFADIQSKYTSYNTAIVYPWLKDKEQTLSFSLAFNHRKSQTFLLGDGTPFSEGVASDGRSSTSVLRFSQEYMLRKPNFVLAARSTLNWGIDALNVTINNKNIADSEFVSWLGQLESAYRITDYNSQIITKANIQFANQRLLSLEQIAIGGPDSVRGYRANYYIRDNGIDLSLEYHHPIIGNPINKTQINLQLAGFIDLGTAWNKGQSYTTDLLSSAGIGLILQWQKLSAEIYWAYPFKKVSQSSEHYLQDEGISFSLNIAY